MTEQLFEQIENKYTNWKEMKLGFIKQDEKCVQTEHHLGFVVKT